VTKWKYEDINFIKNNYNNMTYIDMAKKLNKNYASLKKMAYKIGIPSKFQRSSEEDILSMYKDYIEGMPFSKIGIKYNKTPGSLCSLFKRHKLKARSTSEAMRIYNINENFFDKIDSEEKAYIFGFICSDGHVSDKQIIFKIKESDKDILYKIRNCFGSNVPIRVQVQHNRHYAILRLTNKYLCNKLRGHGIISRKTYHMQVPNVIPKEFLRHYYRGLFDGDGCLGIYSRIRKNGVLEKFKIAIICSGDKLFLKYIKDDILNNSGAFCGSILVNKNSMGTSYQMRWWNKQAFLLTKWMYSNCNIYLIRKNEIAKKMMEAYKYYED
jgi:hypothetical protein